jgi:hypothetical protein
MKIRKFKSGAIRDNEDQKEDYIETISWSAMKRYAKFMTAMKSKYGEGNFKKGINDSSYERSAVRHIQKYLENKYELGNCEIELDHLSAVIFNVLGLIHNEEMRKKDKNYVGQ